MLQIFQNNLVPVRLSKGLTDTDEIVLLPFQLANVISGAPGVHHF